MAHKLLIYALTYKCQIYANAHIKQRHSARDACGAGRQGVGSYWPRNAAWPPVSPQSSVVVLRCARSAIWRQIGQRLESFNKRSHAAGSAAAGRSLHRMPDVSQLAPVRVGSYCFEPLDQFDSCRIRRTPRCRRQTVVSRRACPARRVWIHPEWALPVTDGSQASIEAC